MAPRKDKLKQTMAEDRKRLLLRARKWPYANVLFGSAVAAGAYVGFSWGGDIVHVLLMAFLGLVGGAVLKKPFSQVENRISAKLYDMASTIEIVEQTDVKDKSAPNTLVDEFGLDYCGGHLAWRVDKGEYGSLQVFERALAFKNLKNRLRMPMTRVNRVTVESLVQVRIKHLPDVFLPNAGVSRNKALAAITTLLRRQQRYVVIDYTDDTNTHRFVVFWPRWGNPRYAKQVKDGLDAALKKNQKDRSGGSHGTASLASPTPSASEPEELKRTIAGPLKQTIVSRGGLPSVSREAIEAAQRASMAEQDFEPETPAPAADPSPAAHLCSFCKFSLKEPVVICSVCGAELHEGCWKANFGCTTKECKGKPQKNGESGTLAPDTVGGVAVATEVKFQVIIASAGRDAAERQTVATQMAGVFNLPVERCVQILQKLPTVAKRNVGKADADQLAARLTKIGALAKVQRMPDS